MRRSLLASVLFLACAIAGTEALAAQPKVLEWVPRTAPPSPDDASYLSDRDGDGDPDYAFVIDWDDDGTLEMEDDIQAAIDALTDPGDKLVQIGPGEFQPPVVAQGLNGIVELPSNLTLEGSGSGVTILRGFVETDVTSFEGVLANDDHPGGNANITIRNLEIDGGWRGGDASSIPIGQHRMGVFLNRCSNCRVEYTTVRDTLHACLYSKNGSEVLFQGNSLSTCGNYAGLGPTYSCVYLYADSGETQSTAHVVDNACHRSGAAGISLRRADTTSTVTDIHITGNSIEASRTDGVATSPCMMLRGAQNVYVTGNNLCYATGGVQTADVDDYYDSAVGAIRNLLVEDLVVIDTGAGASGLRVADYVESATFRRIDVVGTSFPIQCMTITNPMRDVLFEDIRLLECGGLGIFENTSHGSGNLPDERLTFRRVEIDSNGGGDGIYFQGPVQGMTFEDVSLTGTPGNGLRFLGEVRDTTLTGLAIENAGGHGILIEDGAAGLLIEGAELSGTGGDGILFDAGGYIEGGSLELRRSTLTDIGRKGIEVVVNGLGLQAMTVADNRFEEIAREGIALYANAGTSDAVTVSDNVVRDFGRLVPGSVDSRGIEITGSVSGLEVVSNLLEDLNDQAERGIFLDIDSAADPLSLCTNECAGTLDSVDCIRVVGETAYEIDSDSDAAVDACDCSPLDGTTYPNAPEVNDAADNQCPGDVGYGLIDEISGLCGFHNPADRLEFSWPPQAGATDYEAARFEAADLSAGCATTTTGAAYWSDATIPLPGEGLFYLVRPLSPHTGSWGADSGGSERTVVCP